MIIGKETDSCGALLIMSVLNMCVCVCAVFLEFCLLLAERMQ